MPKTNSKISETSVYPERESKTLELKSRLPEFRTLAKTCIAFANCSGGEIVIGVEDGSRKIIGVSQEPKDEISFKQLSSPARFLFWQSLLSRFFYNGLNAT